MPPVGSIEQALRDAFLDGAENSGAAELEESGKLFFAHGAVGMIGVGSREFVYAVDNDISRKR